jgi:signal transduction histidine kinase
MRVGFQIRYGSVWARLIACLGTANIVWYAVGGRVMEMMETILYDVFLETRFYGYPDVPAPGDTILVFALCLAPALVRAERPLALAGSGLAMAAGYALLFLAGIYVLGIAIPLAGPLFGLAVSTTVLGSMAWSEERQRRRHLERLEARKQEFTDMLVHDLKGRISSLRVSLHLLEKEGAAADRKRILLDTIRCNTDRMLLQVGALLDIRKMEEGRMVLRRQAVALTGLMAESLREHDAAARLVGVTFRTSGSDPAGCKVDADPDVLTRVLSNLLWNALGHAPPGSEIEVLHERRGDAAAISVSNQGPAIPREEQRDLFQAFVSHGQARHDAVPAGTGLGLAFCKLAVEAHGGAIRLESPWTPDGRGVRVIVTLPVAAALPA